MAHGLNSIIKHETECNDDVRTGSASSSVIKPNYNASSNISTVIKLEHSIRTVNSVCAPQQGGASANSGPVVQMTVTPPTKMGSRRIFSPQFKLQVLDSYRNDPDCKGNQRATARKYGIHRRQIQKWLQCEGNLRSTVLNGGNAVKNSHNANQSKSAPASTLTTPTVHASTHATGFVSPIHNTYVYEPTVSYPTHYEISTAYPSTSSSEGYLSVNYDSYYQTPQLSNTATEHYETRSFIDLPSTSTPIDLSLHRKRLHGEPIDNDSGIYIKKAHKCGDWKNNCKIITDLTTSYPKAAVEAVDLSCRKTKSASESSSTQQVESPKTPSKPVKLFKPYLLDNDDEAPALDVADSCKDVMTGNSEKKLDKNVERNDPIIWTNHPTPSTSSISSCSPVYESSNNFFPNDYNLYSNSLYQISPSSYEIASYWYPPQSSPPVSGYDSAASISSNLSDTSELPYDSYAYQSIKYHQYTHHKDIHKWLQEDHLRNRMIITN